MAQRGGWWFSAACVAFLSFLLALALRLSPVSLIMGQSGSKLSVADALSLDPVEGSPSSVSTKSLSPDAVDARLLSLGIDPSLGGDPPASESDRASCLDRVSAPDFWRTHHASHPNAKRVKAWMFVHSKYREQLGDVVSLAQSTAGGGEPRKFPKLRLAAGKFLKKITRHSKFEDEQLFRFFREEVVPKGGEGDEALGKMLETLMEQHGGEEKDRSDAVTECLEEAKASCAEDENGGIDEERRAAAFKKVAEALAAYQKEMLAHLELEEQTLVGRWLGLPTDLYKIYREKYLKFPYSFMY